MKNGYGASNQVELLIDEFTKVEKAEIQLKVNDFSFTISQYYQYREKQSMEDPLK